MRGWRGAVRIQGKRFKLTEYGADGKPDGGIFRDDDADGGERRKSL